MTRKFLFLFGSAALTTALFSATLWGGPTKGAQKAAKADERQFEGYESAPDFPSHLTWLNTEAPISLQKLRGKIVLLDFWTFCCINCMHVIPDLKKLEAKYPNELVVIGVHSAKFTNEKDTEAIRQAILRYGIEHPVVNDNQFEVWHSYGVSSWPTLVLISPQGRIIGGHSGEGAFEVFDPIIQSAIPYFDQKKALTRGPFKTALEKEKAPDEFLSFPGKISADEKTGRLFITDSNHHRIVIANADGDILEIIGSAHQGTIDGPFETAEFHHPQGTFYSTEMLYIADTENHLIRRADLKTRTVTTVLGQTRGTNPQQTKLSSPWDVLLLNSTLYIAMAGRHQLWEADTKTWEMKPFAGSGREARIDGPRLKAALAQPSGLATDGRLIYFADSETSSVRSADPAPEGVVETLAGSDLFDYGDIDGDLKIARLQHALGTAWKDGQLYVADTYNSKIKVIDPVRRITTGVSGSAPRGAQDGKLRKAGFNEPGGLTFLNGKLYVADTNNHKIRVIDLANDSVSTLTLKEKSPPRETEERKFRGKTIRLAEARAAPGNVELQVDIRLPPDQKFTKNAPSEFELTSNNDNAAFPAKVVEAVLSQNPPPVKIAATLKPGQTEIEIRTTVFHCLKEGGRCFFDSVRIQAPLTVEASAPKTLPLTISIEPPELTGNRIKKLT